MKVKVKLDSENLIELVEQDMTQATDSSTAQIYVTAAVAHAILALVATIKEESNKEKELKNAYFLRDDEQKEKQTSPILKWTCGVICSGLIIYGFLNHYKKHHSDSI